MKHIKNWLNELLKLSAYKNRLIFLLNCKYKQVYPKHILNNLKCLYALQAEQHPYIRETDILIKSLKYKIVNLEIRITAWKIRTIEKNIRNTCNYLEKKLNLKDFTDCTIFFKQKYEYKFKNIKDNNIKKLNNLLKENSQNNNNINSQNTCVFNFTDVRLPKEVEKILNLEPGYGIPLRPMEVPVGTLIKDLEDGIKNIYIENVDTKIIKDEQNNVRSKAVRIISNYYNNKKNQKLWKNEIKDNYLTTKRFLKQNPNLIITRSDKGNNTVIMEKEEYIKEMNKLLEDRNTYSILNKDPTNRFEKLANNLTIKLQNESIISEEMGKNLRSYNSVAPKLYGLRKTHKKECALRPVFFYNLVKINSIYTKLKDRVDKLEQSNLVYKIPCVCDKCYIGQTKPKLKKRLEQHKNDCKPINAQKSNITALAEHHFSTEHKFKFDETNILDKEDNWYKRNISEMYHITNNNTVNYRTDTNNLNNIYNEILKFNYHNKTH
ncbi:hypothetical protein M0804_013356 [Polistes exclamans]|nr:hypothetical protein M0804_013356 [Polistes exclamans]